MEFRNTDDAAMGLEDNLAVEAPKAKAPSGKAVKMDASDSGSAALVADAAAGALAAVAKAAAKPVVDSKTVNARRFTVVTDNARDALLTDFGKDTLTDRYLLPGENYQDLFRNRLRKRQCSACHHCVG